MTLAGLIAQAGAPGLGGLKEDPIPPFSGTTTGLGVTSLFQMILALAIVVLLIRWIVPKYLSKAGRKRSADEPGGEIEVLATTPVGSGHIHLIRTRGRTMLLGSAQQGITLISDLEEDSVFDNLPTKAGENGSGAAGGSQSGSFDDVLSRLRRLEG
ncbi:MAG: flagellar biosynthetic protein FliO [Armatimonadetes bacterium]|nr:flagellar biosynthetic protein FliO [Armatimonadota bacterium]